MSDVSVCMCAYDTFCEVGGFVGECVFRGVHVC